MRSDPVPLMSYLAILKVNGASIAGAFFLCGLITVLARLSGQPDAANRPIVFAVCAVVTIGLFFARARMGEFYRLMALGSMVPLMGMLGYNLWGLSLGVIMVGLLGYFLFRPRTVWRSR